MKIQIFASKQHPPLAALLTAEFVRPEIQVDVEWHDEVESSARLSVDAEVFGEVSICRLLARLSPQRMLFGSQHLEQAQVDHWLMVTSIDPFQLEQVLTRSTFLIPTSHPTIADFSVLSQLKRKPVEVGPNVRRWWDHLFSMKKIADCIALVEKVAPIKAWPPKENKDETKQDRGKFVELPGAVIGKVVVRFPPEASGYLHIGHAKAALLNQHYQLYFNGKLVLRFDDTNPDKEKENFEHVIIEDVAMLGIKPDIQTFTSDSFPVIQDMCVKLLRQGDAYVDDTDADTMKKEREARQESKHRTNSVEKNLQMWGEMVKGTEYGLRCCVRAKIDMNSNNGCMRDPTIYRCKVAVHPRQGTKYNVYPTYDFACPIVDSIEGITHALRTTEYHDRDEQFYWVIDKLGLRKPFIYEYSRLSLMNTVLSKRKLTYFVEQGVVTGWDDPRMPTVRGVLRRGLTVEGLKEFILAQGSSKSVVMMSWDKLWAFNKKRIEATSKRFYAVEADGMVEVHIDGLTQGEIQVAWHPKDSGMGTKRLAVSKVLLVDKVDAEQMKIGDTVTFMSIGNVKITEALKNGQIKARADLDDKDFKKTLKVSWISKSAKNVRLSVCYMDNIISKAVLSPDDDFKKYVRKITMVDVGMLGESNMSSIKKGDIIQIQRKGFFICDSVGDLNSEINTGLSPLITLIFVPDGGKDVSSLPSRAQDLIKGKLEASVFQPTASAQRSATSTSKPATDECDAASLWEEVTVQGNKIRKMKGDKAEKKAVESEVQTLLKLKTKYKAATGMDYDPKSRPTAFTVSDSAVGETANELNEQIRQQGDKVRQVEIAKAAKDVVTSDVNVLLSLKAKLTRQELTGSNWSPNSFMVKPSPIVDDLSEKITAQSNKVRQLKSDKAAKDVVLAEVQALQTLKVEYKALTGSDWVAGGGGQPVIPVPSVNFKSTNMSEGDSLDAKIKTQGEKIRALKGSNTSKEDLQPEIDFLLALKAKYKEQTGKAHVAEGGAAKEPSKVKSPGSKLEKKPSPQPQVSTAKNVPKKQTRLGLEATKEDNLPEWYSQVITKAEMIEYYDVSGCYVLRPWAYGIWQRIQEFFDKKIKAIGVENCYFPMFVSSKALEKEKSHIADFSPEVAWVTKSGSSDMVEPIAIRPTSETVMYPSYAKWIKSHRDLPLKLNQWCNVVRWEFKNPQPFLRTREFLWQEGHTAHANCTDAIEEVHEILAYYAEVYEKLLAVPVIRGKKTEKEKFAGGFFTTTVEAFVPATGRGIQGATSHHLGQNFSEIFDIAYENPETHEKQFVYQNSWGLTTRTIGVMVMVHGDNQGLVVPPQVAHYQVVVIPCGITVSLLDDDKKKIIDRCQEVTNELRSNDVRVYLDNRDNYSPGWKFNHWELKGVPVRIEIGPKDLASGQFVAVRRDTMAKSTHKVGGEIVQLLDTVQSEMFAKAKKEMDSHVKLVGSMEDFIKYLEVKCILLAPFCGNVDCEDEIKKLSTCEQAEPGTPAMGAKSLCIPFEQPKELSDGEKCIRPGCTNKPQSYTLFGRSY